MTLRLVAPSLRLVILRRLGTLAILISILASAPTAHARTTASHHRHPRLRAMRYMLSDVMLPGIGILPDEIFSDDDAPQDGEKFELKLARQDGDSIDVVYRIGDTYIPEALDQLSHFLHDSHNEEVKSYDPRTFDLLHTMLAKVHRSSSAIQILSAYRSQETNDALRASGTTNAAEHSQHIEAKALDIRVSEVPAAELRAAALALGAGGVGYYPKSQFVHVDTGPVREWTYASHKVTRPHHHRRHRS